MHAAAAWLAGGVHFNSCFLGILARRYAERLVITRPVTIQAAPGDAVELTWQSNEPYQSTIEVDAQTYPELAEPSAVVLQGLRVRHSSPSIANNYAVRLVVSADVWVLKGCLIGEGSMFGVVCSRADMVCPAAQSERSEVVAPASEENKQQLQSGLSLLCVWRGTLPRRFLCCNAASCKLLHLNACAGLRRYPARLRHQQQHRRWHRHRGRRPARAALQRARLCAAR